MGLEAYVTVAGEAQDEFVERRSRFIGAIAPAATEEEAVAFLQEKRSRCWDATHNVYAYILRQGQTQRYSDDGEPQGTAGIPVLEVLRREGLVDVVLVATRYFGGILLGGGGLVRAYSHTAKIAVDAAVRRYMTPCVAVRLELDYSLYGRVANLLPRHGAVVQDSDFGAAVRLELAVETGRYPAFARELEELTSAAVYPQVLGEIYCDRKPWEG